MIDRIAIFAASLAAAGVLVAALVLAGFAPARPATSAAATVATAPAPTPQVQVDTVYLAPPQQPDVVTVHRVQPARGGDDEGEREGSDD